ncbi:MAG: NUDIX domain-containing protein [Lachnospiraceae bacterium]
MHDMFLRVKGIAKKEDKYLVLKRWMDDRIPDPFVWEFIDGVVNPGEGPDDAMLRLVNETVGVSGRIERILYTWSQMLGDTQCVGIAYLLSIEGDESQFVLPEELGEWEWIPRERFEYYIENRNVLKNLESAQL